jgi:uncharacterized protein with PIN domain
MVLDTSAIVAMLLKEPGFENLIEKIGEWTRRWFLSPHPAALNFGDCQSYAISSVAGLPLLFTPRDLIGLHTDHDRAIPPEGRRRQL